MSGRMEGSIVGMVRGCMNKRWEKGGMEIKV
jgi:hypothetical protein